MQFDLTLKKFLDTQNTNAGDSNSGNVIPQSIVTLNMDSNTLPRPSSEIWRQVGTIDYAEQLYMLINKLTQNHSVKARQMRSTSVRSKNALKNNNQCSEKPNTTKQCSVAIKKSGSKPIVSSIIQLSWGCFYKNYQLVAFQLKSQAK